MQKLLEDVLESGDVLELESAIIGAQSSIVASPNPRQVSSQLNDILLRCRKTLVLRLEECKPLLKPLRRACRNFDEEALTDALHRVHCAPPELRRYMRTDIRQAEALRSRMRQAAEEAHRLMQSRDWREVDHFLNTNTAILPDRTVLALMQRREALFVPRCGQPTNTPLCLPDLPAPSLSDARSQWPEEKVRPGTHASLALGAVRCDEENSRHELLEEEHHQRVLCFKSVMEAIALLLVPLDGTQISAEEAAAAISKTPRSVTAEVTPVSRDRVSASPSRSSPDGGCGAPPVGGALTPKVSPIKSSLLVDSAARMEPRRLVGLNSPSAETRDNSSSYIVLEGTITPSLRERQAVVSPRVWAQVRSVMREEDVRRHNIEGTEDFERSVFLLPMAARSALLTRILPGRRSWPRGS
ncbi:Trichohyalin [Trypanosoma grayi]|uniref:Trichohyalin n=1 Tax=Trypanosoma grayi TaxID=71804 RepID=UPI0004F49299|nr:Trichohyalin [Trypanosoma grayi]KEG10500.1 Trichohyalin [Trypanosoma grayi]